MTRKDEAVANFDDYLDGWFFSHPGMERMLDASKDEKAAKKAFDDNFASLNDKMGGAAESQGGLKDVTARRKLANSISSGMFFPPVTRYVPILANRIYFLLSFPFESGTNS